MFPTFRDMFKGRNIQEEFFSDISSHEYESTDFCGKMMNQLQSGGTSYPRRIETAIIVFSRILLQEIRNK
jgi:hypothetical protein